MKNSITLLIGAVAASLITTATVRADDNLVLQQNGHGQYVAIYQRPVEPSVALFVNNRALAKTPASAEQKTVQIFKDDGHGRQVSLFRGE